MPSPTLKAMTDSIYLANVYRIEAVNFWKSAKILSATLELKNDGSPASGHSFLFPDLARRGIAA